MIRKQSIKKASIGLLFSILLMSEYSIAEAAPEVMPSDGGIFDADYYASEYPEIANAVGTDANALYMHYNNCGMYENRTPFYACSFHGETDFAKERIRVFGNVQVKNSYVGPYIYRCADNCSLFYGKTGVIRLNDPAIPEHYSENQWFDAKRYANDNPDLVAIYGYDAEKLWLHYKTIGVYEGRRAYALNDEANAALRIIDVAEQITNANMTDEQKILAVHTWMAQNIAYDVEADINSAPAFEITGAMLNGKAVCLGYAGTFDYFMSILGIYCEVVMNEQHAWNRVLIDGEWKYIDITWADNDATGKIAYDYYMIPLEQMSMYEYHRPEYVFKFYQ